MSNSIADLRPGASVTGPNGDTFTVISVKENTIHVKKLMCVIENQRKQQITVPSDILTPIGKHAAEIALRISGKTILIGDTLTFLTKSNTYRQYVLKSIAHDKITIERDHKIISIDINDLTGVSLLV